MEIKEHSKVMSKKAKIPTVSETIQMLKDEGSFDSKKFKKYKRKLQYIYSFCIFTVMYSLHTIIYMQGNKAVMMGFLFSMCAMYTLIVFLMIRDFRRSFYLANFGDSALASVQFVKGCLYYKSNRCVYVEYIFDVGVL